MATINGTAGDDTLNGTAGDDIINGLDGTDILIGGQGSDVLDGGSGIDTAAYSGSAAGVTVDLAAGTGVGGDAEGDTLIGIEFVRGSSFADHLYGDAGGQLPGRRQRRRRALGRCGRRLFLGRRGGGHHQL